MAFELPELPYPLDALQPAMSERTLEYHHGKHHAGYVEKLNDAIAGSAYEKSSLEEVIRASFSNKDTRVFNNAAQHWNHSFFWHSMSPHGGKRSRSISQILESEFGSYEKFRDEFVEKGASQFGSGWVWLIQKSDGLEVVSTGNADLPLVRGHRALLACDVWEHAYYLDFQNQRKKYLTSFLDHLSNWEFVEWKLNHSEAA